MISNDCGRGSRPTSTARPAASCTRRCSRAGGRTSPTAVGDDAHEWVLRRPPLGHVLPTAHDMAREYTVLAALAPTNVPVPQPLRVLRRPGRERRSVLRDGEGRRRHPAHARGDRDADARRRAPLRRGARRRARRDSRRRLHRGRAHRVRSSRRVRRTPSAAVGRTVGTLEDARAARDRRARAPAARRAPRVCRRPRSCTATIASTTRCSMPTISGASSRCSTGRWRPSAIRSPTSASSSCTTAATKARRQASARRSRPRPASSPRRSRRALRQAIGRDVSQLDFYEALAAYKLAIILEGIHARFLMGKTVGEGFDHIGALVEIMVQGALEPRSRSSIAALRGN